MMHKYLQIVQDTQNYTEKLQMTLKTTPHWQKIPRNRPWPATSEPDPEICRVFRDQKFCP